MNIKKFIKYLYLFSIVLTISCSGSQVNQTAAPTTLLNHQQMAAVLCDIQIAEAAVTQKNLNSDSANGMNNGYYSFIYRKHQVTQNDFENSYHYYLSTPEEMDSIYASVLQILTARESELRALGLKPAPEVKIDSAGKVTVIDPLKQP